MAVARTAGGLVVHPAAEHESDGDPIEGHDPDLEKIGAVERPSLAGLEVVRPVRLLPPRCDVGRGEPARREREVVACERPDCDRGGVVVAWCGLVRCDRSWSSDTGEAFGVHRSDR